jgi:hypothetical protein
MKRLLLAATEVSPDEWGLDLSEVNLQSPDSPGWRRYQVVTVPRGERLAEWRRDLGPASAFTADQFRVPGGVVDDVTGRFEPVHTVGELWDIADYLRENPFPHDDIVRTDLVQRYHDAMDMRLRLQRGAKVSARSRVGQS